MKCAVCGNALKEKICEVCGFGKTAAFEDKEKQAGFLKTVAIPFGINYILSQMQEKEASRVRLVIYEGLDISSAAKKEDVREERIKQILSKFRRRLSCLYCVRALNDIL